MHSSATRSMEKTEGKVEGVTNTIAPSSHDLLTVRELLSRIESKQLKVPLPSAALSSSSTASAAPRPLIRLRGWIRSIRGSKATSFLLINDGTSLLSVQCVVDAAVAEKLGQGGKLENGASVEVEGEVVWSYRTAQALTKQLSDTGSIDIHSSFASAVATASASPMPQLPMLEILASNVRLFGACDQTTYPITKQSLPLEYLREHLHLRTRTATLAAVMRIRSHTQYAVHEFFREEGFFNVHTPILTPLDCEGAGEVFSQCR
jgi:asparaginyl-tRNA synthetase